MKEEEGRDNGTPSSPESTSDSMLRTLPDENDKRERKLTPPYFSPPPSLSERPNIKREIKEDKLDCAAAVITIEKSKENDKASASSGRTNTYERTSIKSSGRHENN